MNRRPLDVEIIEVLAPDDPGLGTSAARGGGDGEPPSPPAEVPPRRWRTLLGAVIAVAVVCAVAWWWPDAKQTDVPHAAPSTTVQSGPLRPPTGYYLLDNSVARGLALYSADVVASPGKGEQFQLWDRVDGTRDASLLMHSRHTTPGYAIRGGVRKLVGGHELVSEPWGGTFSQVDSGDLVTDVEARGVPDQQLVTALDAVQRASGLLGSGRPVAFFTGNFEMVAKGARPEELIFGVEQTRVRYTMPDSTIITLHVGSGDPKERKKTIPFVGRARDSSGGYESGILAWTDESYVAWHDGDILLTLTGPIERATLLDIARTVKAADPDLWNQYVVSTKPDYQLGDFATTNSGVDAEGVRWAAGLQLASLGSSTQYLWWWTLPGHPERTASMPAGDLMVEGVSETVVVPGSTYVFMSLPRDYQQPATVIIAADSSQLPIEAVVPFPELGISLAVVRVDVPGPTRPG